MTIHLAAACAQLGMHLSELTAQLYAIAPELRDDRSRADVANQVRMFGNDLIDPTSAQAQATTYAAYMAVWGPGACSRAWWKTPLGQAVAHVIGYPGPDVPCVTAGAILGVSRQYIYQLREKGILEVGSTDGTITAASLRQHIQSKA